MHSFHGKAYSWRFKTSECPGFSRCSDSSGASIVADGLPFLVTTNMWPLATSATIRLRRLRAWLIGIMVTNHAVPGSPLPSCREQSVLTQRPGTCWPGEPHCSHVLSESSSKSGLPGRLPISRRENRSSTTTKYSHPS